MGTFENMLFVKLMVELLIEVAIILDVIATVKRLPYAKLLLELGTKVTYILTCTCSLTSLLTIELFSCGLYAYIISSSWLLINIGSAIALINVVLLLTVENDGMALKYKKQTHKD